MICHRVNNIKVSFKIDGASQFFLRQFAQSSPLVSKVDGNFFVLRDRFVFVIFFTGHVNCTKLRTLTEIDEAKQILDDHLLGSWDFSASKVDNISASGFSGVNRLNLRKFGDFLKVQNLNFKYNPERFPGLNFRISGVTFVLFASGNFLAVGSKSLSDLSIIVGVFSKYMKNFLDSDSPCQSIAVETRRD